MTSFTLNQLPNAQGFRVEVPYSGPHDRKGFASVLNAAGEPIKLSNGTIDKPRIMVDQASDGGTKGFEISTAASESEIRQSLAQRVTPAMRR